MNSSKKNDNGNNKEHIVISEWLHTKLKVMAAQKKPKTTLGELAEQLILRGLTLKE